MAIISIIAAIGKNYELGRNNDLLWHIPADLKRFKMITSGHTVIMGRKTFDSINNRPLPNRRNIVITHNSKYNFEGIEVAHSVQEAMGKIGQEEEVFILGGATIYEQFLTKTDKMYLTMIDSEFDADAFFPRFDMKQWEIAEHIPITDDEQAGLNYSFLTLQRIR
jgi:dihydrofolate reductase